MIKTCSKESGQRLVELGVTVESFFSFAENPITKKARLVFTHDIKPVHRCLRIITAYTACELGEMLKEMNISYRWNLAGEFECLLHFGLNSINDYETYAIEIAEAMALMLIWLLENGHITAEQINEAA